MRRSSFFAASALLVLGLLWPRSSVDVLAAQERETNSCKVCHSEAKTEYGSSVHAQRGIECQNCHGGNPADFEMSAMSPRAGFRGKPSKREMVSLCSSCHADPVRMKPYGISTSQFSEYKTSQHGIRLLSNNDERAPGCTDCHEKHRILPASDPRSQVYKANVPGLCARCHSDPELMRPYDLPSDQYAKYAISVHGQALLEGRNDAAPNCARCHGTHGAMPPGVTTVADVCGQCHANTRDYFAKSPHKKAMDLKLMSECVSCHGSHDVTRSSLGLFETICTRCHEKDSDAYRAGQEIKNVLVKAQVSLDQAQKLLDQGKLKGLDLQEEESSLREAETFLVQVQPVQHTLSLPDVEDLTERASSLGQDVSNRVNAGLAALRQRRTAMGYLWIGILFVVGVLYLKYRQLVREHESTPPPSS